MLYYLHPVETIAAAGILFFVEPFSATLGCIIDISIFYF